LVKHVILVGCGGSGVGGWRQKDREFQASLGYKWRPSLKNHTKKKKKKLSLAGKRNVMVFMKLA
jgi:hypothetical protein